MKKIICIALMAIALVMAGSSPGDAFRGGHFGHGGHVRVGVFVGGPVWDPWWWGPGYPYYPYYPYYAPAPVVIEQPDGFFFQRDFHRHVFFHNRFGDFRRHHEFRSIGMHGGRGGMRR